MELRLPAPDWRMFYYLARPRVVAGFSLNSAGDTNNGYLGFLWRLRLSSRWFAEYSLGLAYHDGVLHYRDSRYVEPRHEFGSRVVFRNAFLFGIHLSERWSLGLAVDHLSNAYLAPPNEGLNSVGLVLCVRLGDNPVPARSVDRAPAKRE